MSSRLRWRLKTHCDVYLRPEVQLKHLKQNQGLCLVVYNQNVA